MESVLQYEAVVRLSVFLGILAAMAIWEVAAPRRRVEIPKLLRWSNKLTLVVLDAIAVRVLFPIAAVGVAVLAADNGWGLFNQFDLPIWLVVVLCILVLDLAIYAQHMVFHAVPALWRLHRMHHADLEIDVSTGLRFHPVEIILSMAVKICLVALLGAPAIAVLLFEILLNGMSMFNHSNIKIPGAIERWLRLFFVTPDMHRVHHSVIVSETNSNFGFNVPWWDRLFGTYNAQPEKGHEGMQIGLERFRTRRDLWIDRMLLQPLRGSRD